MFINLSAGAIGIQTDLAGTIELAQRHRFVGIDFSIREAAEMAAEQGVDSVRNLFDNAGVRPGAWGFPVDFRNDADSWRADLAALPQQAAVARELGCTRTCTWIMPGSDERNFAQNFEFHVERLKPAAEILADQGILFGLEWVGPKTLRDRFAYPFIHTMAGMLELCNAIGTGNMGLLVDIWHIYTSHGTMDEVRSLRPEQIAQVHVNDAPAGIPVDEQQDNVRDLPGATGVLDLSAFLHALRDIGYNGPVTAEPFSQRLRELSPDEAAAETSAAMHAMWQNAGLD